MNFELRPGQSRRVAAGDVTTLIAGEHPLIRLRATQDGIVFYESSGVGFGYYTDHAGPLVKVSSWTSWIDHESVRGPRRRRWWRRRGPS